MTFNSMIFVAFFPVVYLLVRLSSQKKYQNLCLLVASYIFYGYWDPRFAGLLLLTTAIDYAAGIMMTRQPDHRRRWLIISLILNLGILGVFKYFNFFLSSL